MNTHDIDLPPLPPLRIVPSVEPVDYPEVAQALMDYARAAIGADRKRQGDAAKVLAELVALIPLADTLNASASCQDLINYFKGVIADRQRRGKPVAWEHRFRALPDGQWTAWGPGKAPTLRTDSYEVQERALYTAPQPDEPAKVPSADPFAADRNDWQEMQDTDEGSTEYAVHHQQEAGRTRYVKVNGKWVRCTILKNGARLISAPVGDD